ncbi:MAG TPA: alkaline phosphatase family protein [Candidatus Paceibacterota bacterium]|nr:alkaline phosphatase family protein [Verrucomicrobiota bacterium]HRY47555.1 alkaline phosphatase family protein [Candidatus Paceibacterota bacterium]HSA02278.1 alkaline phosphatase family protein [Candidatus Paceibacterota bacterium]
MRCLAISLAVTSIILAGCHSSIRNEPASVKEQAGSSLRPGPQADGAVLLPNQWRLRPVGRQIQVGDFPVNLAVHPEGRYVAALHCGYGPHELVILDLNTSRLCSRAILEEAFYGLTFSPRGDRIYCSGASLEVIHEFDFKGGFLSGHRTIRLRAIKERGIPSGMALDKNGQRLWVANLLGQSLSQVDLATRSVAGEWTLIETEVKPHVPPELLREGEDEDAITKRARALLEHLNSEAPYPYACLVDENRGRLYVSLWGQAAVQILDLNTGKPLARWPVQEHPNEMLLNREGTRLFVANANRNTVSVVDTADGQTVELLVAALEPNAPPGSTPCSLALSPDETLLFVAQANINAIAVFQIETGGRSRSLGFIPVGWYPTAVRVTPDGRKLVVANGKGSASRANRQGPQPGYEFPATVREYIGGLFPGTLSVIDLPDATNREPRMREWTARCYQNRPPTVPQSGPPKLEANLPIPSQPGNRTPIRYCIYIIKENRTYDQVLGDLPQGNGDPSLCLFPEPVTPNHHKLAREFVLLDNFYVESEVSADGHEWTVGAYATDYVEKIWPLSYGHNSRGKYTYPSEGRFKIAQPSEGYLWDRARDAGISYRSYGEFVNNGTTPNDPCTTRVPSLEGHFDPWFRSFDMDYSDLARADRFISELQRFEREGDMPRLQIVRLPNDHTAGASVGKLTPTSYLAENDLAFGRIVEAISHSKFWPQTAIFVVEDDAQNGPDHVDAHRTIAYAISPYSRRGAVDSTLYSTASMLRTIELILGLRPMSQFDAAARPMFDSFQARPNLRPYQAEMPRVSLTDRNSRQAWGSELSSRMNFAREDAADDLLLNQVVWRSVKGPDHPMPPPTRAAFVLDPRR